MTASYTAARAPTVTSNTGHGLAGHGFANLPTNAFAFVGEYCFHEPDHLPTPVGRQVLVGSVRHATMVPMLRRLGVTHVVNCAAGDCSVPVGEYEEVGIEYMPLRGVDNEGYPILKRHLEQLLQFVGPVLDNSTLAKGREHANKGRVLLHCVAGRNRSVALAVALVLIFELMPLPNIVRRLFQRRPFVLTNQSFRQQLSDLAEQQGLLTSPSPLVGSGQVDGGHKALVGFKCRHCGQPHCVSDEARLDFSLTVDCSTFRVTDLVECLSERFGAAPNIEFETLAEADNRQTAVSNVGYKDAALGRADSLLVPRSTPLPLQPFHRLALADLPEPIGCAGPGKPSVLTCYDTRRRTVYTLGVYHEPGKKALEFALCRTPYANWNL